MTCLLAFMHVIALDFYSLCYCDQVATILLIYYCQSLFTFCCLSCFINVPMHVSLFSQYLVKVIYLLLQIALHCLSDG